MGVAPLAETEEQDCTDVTTGGYVSTVGVGRRGETKALKLREDQRVRMPGKVDLSQAPINLKTVLRLAIPTLAEQMLFAVVGLTDAAIAGHTGNNAREIDAASAAVGVMSYLQWFAGITTAALGVGAMAIVSRSIGAKRIRVANRVAGTSIMSALLVGLLVATIFFLFARPIVQATGLTELAADYGIQYLQIMCITLCLQTGAQIGMMCLRGAGDTVRPMVITGLVMVVNFIFSASFTFGWLGMPRWGIQGNAFGTLLAFLFSGVVTMALLVSGTAKLKLQLRHFKIVPHVLWRVLKIGLPSWLEGTLLWVGQFLIVILVINSNDQALSQLAGASRAGVTMGAHNNVLRIESLAFLPGFGFGIATSALVGQMLGAGRMADAKRAVYLTLRLAFITMTLAAIPMVLFPSFLLGCLVNSPEMVQMGRWPMILAGLAQPGFAIAIIMGSALKGAGETVLPMVTTLLGIFVVRVPILFFCVWIFTKQGHPEWGLIAVWIGIFTDLAFRGGLNSVGFLRGKWMTKKV